MRPIKFRAWDKDEKQMLYRVEGVYDSPYHPPLNIYGEKLDDWTGARSFGELLDNDSYQVMQFTGLTDRHGREIYEGDILKSEEGIAVVEYIDNGFWCHIEKPRMRTGNYFPAPIDREIIGNVHENGDLLK